MNADAACGRRRLDPLEVFQREGLISGRRETAQYEVCPMRPVRYCVPVRTAAGYRRRNRSRACRPDESLQHGAACGQRRLDPQEVCPRKTPLRQKHEFHSLTLSAGAPQSSRQNTVGLLT